jgi:hypothetical protein
MRPVMHSTIRRSEFRANTERNEFLGVTLPMMTVARRCHARGTSVQITKSPKAPPIEPCRLDQCENPSLAETFAAITEGLSILHGVVTSES